MKPVEAYPKKPKKRVMALEQENAEKRRLICNPKNTHTRQKSVINAQREYFLRREDTSTDYSCPSV